MTDADLATCRAWCRANGVVVRSRGRGNYFEYCVWGLPDWFPGDFESYCCSYENQCYAKVWNRLQPWLASVRNLDAVEVEGPYKVQPWKVREGVQYYCVTNSMSFDFFADMSEQTARRIAAILNRECGK